MTASALDHAALLLRSRAGLNAEPASRTRLERLLHESANLAGIPLTSYVDLVDTQPAAFDDLLDRVTVQHSSFFRDAAQFVAFDELARNASSAPQTIWAPAAATARSRTALRCSSTKGAATTGTSSPLTSPSERSRELRRRSTRSVRFRVCLSCAVGSTSRRLRAVTRSPLSCAATSVSLTTTWLEPMRARWFARIRCGVLPQRPHVFRTRGVRGQHSTHRGPYPRWRPPLPWPFGFGRSDVRLLRAGSGGGCALLQAPHCSTTVPCTGRGSAKG